MAPPEAPAPQMKKAREPHPGAMAGDAPQVEQHPCTAWEYLCLLPNSKLSTSGYHPTAVRVLGSAVPAVNLSSDRSWTGRRVMSSCN